VTIWKSKEGYWYLTLTNLSVEVRVGPLAEKPVQVGLTTTWEERPDGKLMNYLYDFEAGEHRFTIIWHSWDKAFGSERYLPWAEVIVH